MTALPERRNYFVSTTPTGAEVLEFAEGVTFTIVWQNRYTGAVVTSRPDLDSWEWGTIPDPGWDERLLVEGPGEVLALISTYPAPTEGAS